MAVTGIGDVFVPQVIGDVATNILFTRTPLLQSGVVYNAGNSIWAEGGNTVTFPTFETTLGNVQTNPGATRDGVTASKVTASSYTESLLSKIVSFDLDRNALDDAARSLDLNAHVAELVARESSTDIQDTLILRAEETNLVYSALGDSTKTLTVDNILEAKYQWGDYADLGMGVLFAHSKTAKDLQLTSDFKTLASAATNAIVQKYAGLVPPGAIGVVHNCWVVPMDRVRSTAQAKAAGISGITRSGAVATATFASAHGLRVGDQLVITGTGGGDYDGTFAVATVPSTTTVTFAIAGTPTSPATGTPVLTTTYNNLLCAPASLGLYIKKAVQGVVKDVHAGTTVFTTDFDFRYAATLKRVRPRGAVRLFTR